MTINEAIEILEQYSYIEICDEFINLFHKLTPQVSPEFRNNRIKIETLEHNWFSIINRKKACFYINYNELLTLAKSLKLKVFK